MVFTTCQARLDLCLVGPNLVWVLEDVPVGADQTEQLSGRGSPKRTEQLSGRSCQPGAVGEVTVKLAEGAVAALNHHVIYL